MESLLNLLIPTAAAQAAGAPGGATISSTMVL